MGLGKAALPLVLVLGLSPPPETAGPEGLWQTRDDRTGAPRALVRVSIQDGRLRGAIERLFLRPGEDAEPVCSRCRGPRRGQRIVGMEILRGHRGPFHRTQTWWRQ